MTDFMIRLIGMSLQASVVIGVVLLLRLLFQKLNISKKYVMLLWVIPFICLILPWKITSPIGFWDSAPSEYGYESFTSSDEAGENPNDRVTGNSAGGETVAGSDINSIVGNEGSHHTNTDEVISDGQNINSDMVSGDITSSPNAGVIGENNSANTVTDGDYTENTVPISLEQVIAIVTIVWGIIVIGLGLYSTITFCRLKKQLGKRILMRDNIFLADDIPVPMVVGFIKPEIYIPSGIDESHLEYVIAHEQTHIRRKDTIVKVAAYGITCIHWFNPLVWLAYNLLVKDMEMACDEETILRLGQDRKKDYASVLLQLSTGKRNVFAVPLAFGEGSTKARILNVLKYKKTKQIFAVAALVIGILLAVVFLTKDGDSLVDPAEGTEGTESVDTESVDATEDVHETDQGDSWKKMIGLDSTDVAWVKKNLYENMAGWYSDYSGGIVQLISGTTNLGPASREDIVYYKTAETDIQSVINFMAEFMIDPLQYKNRDRTYMITKYRLDEHTVYQVSENAWIIEYINGYYAYKGTEFIPWETAIEQETPDEDGLISFHREGSDGAFAFVLVKAGDVYRLEKMSQMQKKQKDSSISIEEDWYFTYWKNIEWLDDSFVEWIENNILADKASWYEEYDGSCLQRLAGPDDLATAAREDIVFYDSISVDPESAFKMAAGNMIGDLQFASETRSYRIIAGRGADQILYPIDEDVWLIPYINGYYKYEGVDGISMEEALQYVTPDEYGLIPYNRLGSDIEYAYILMRYNGVYRVQKLLDMMEPSEKKPTDRPEDATAISQELLTWFGTEFFNNLDNLMPNAFLGYDLYYESPAEISLYEIFYDGIFGKEKAEITQEEIDLLKIRYPDECDLDIVKIPVADMKETLQKYTGITWEECKKVGLEKFLYLEEYDAYYAVHGDVRVTSYNMISGWMNADGTITLRCRRPDTDFQFRVTLKYENGTYHFVSQMFEV